MLDKLSGSRRAFVVSGFALALLTASAPIFATQKPSNAGQKAGAEAEKKPATTTTEAKPDEKPWSVRVSKGAPHTFTVKAKEANLPEITSELSRQLKVPVSLSPLMSKQRVSLDFGGLNLEATLRLLAPQVYVDYVAGGDDPEPKPLAIYLQALNERPPATNIRGTSEAILIEGDTEEGVGSEEQKKKEEEDPLRVTFANNTLSVRARKQPLSVVLYKIATEVGVPFEMRYESSEVVDVEFTNYSVEQAVRSLSPAVRFYYRLDLQTFQVQPLRIALVAPSAPKS